MKCRVVIIALAVCCFFGQNVSARSTFTVRTDIAGIAGPDINYVLMLYLHYFPGDGEAIVGSELKIDPQEIELAKVVSQLGKSTIETNTIAIDYVQQPVSSERIDTLAITMKAKQAPIMSNWQGQIFSTLDSGKEAAHRLTFQLAIEPPVKVNVGLTPLQLFPGEKVDMQAVVENKDVLGRDLQQVTWQWPEGLLVVAGKTTSEWEEGLASGTQDTLNWQIQVDRHRPERLELIAHGATDEVVGTPFLIPALEILPVPIPQLVYADEVMEVGQVTTFKYRWNNPAASEIAIESLTIEIPATFSAVEVLNPPTGLSVTQPTKNQSGRIRLEEYQILGAGEVIELLVSVRPERPGPFAWPSWFRSVGHTEIPLLTGQIKVNVAGASVPLVDASKEIDFITDLEFVSAAFETALTRELTALPIEGGTQIRLQAEEKGDRNWVVDDVLVRVLMDKGFVVTLKDVDTEGEGGHTLHYRLADAKVIYSRVKKGWLPFRFFEKREVQGDLFLRLTTAAGQLLWVAEAKAFATERVEVEDAELLGDSKIVERMIVKSEHKLVERVLSTSIISGLVLIFFSP